MGAVLGEEQMQELEAMGPRHELIELAKEKADEMMKNDDELKRWVDGTTKKKTRQKAKKKCSTEEEPKMKREAPRQATWEEEFAQGRAYFLSKDYSR